eukprot:CAMPEP_0206532060 /NCGR_PEP_ID=MMETSP0325_2-20121206/4136_1 /ASSEMBLY_ACC=CAM_ASM_000347 /TAXON_ID=2866 /ORGANISM="Crypthecodinium cohnii, Strain Seligo" /LENGTH=1549 /DNA_ID=CAMNT_0054028423 /DNA_START=318 /DNA_END=4967 /DNA_ORIENTATION=-
MIVIDELGEPYVVHSATSEAASVGAGGTYRLAPLQKLRLCIPGALELQPAGPDVAESAQGGRFASLSDAFASLIEQGGGVFTWQVPIVEARLRPDIAEECCFTPAPLEWPFCVTAATLGACLEIAVTAPWPPENSPLRRGRWTPAQGLFREEPPIECDGFMMQFLQRGGPPLDPRKLSDCTKDVVVEELDRWASKFLASRPDTWTTLHVNKEEGETSTSLSAPQLVPAAAARRQTGDVIVAVAADAEVALEPFELSYGDAHIGSLRRMLSDEIAHVLGIASERVMCGDFSAGHRVAQKKRHLKQNSIGVRFALLHTELEELRRPKDQTRAALPRPKPLFSNSNHNHNSSNNTSNNAKGPSSWTATAKLHANSNSFSSPNTNPGKPGPRLPGLLQPLQGKKDAIMSASFQKTSPDSFQFQLKDSLAQAGATMTGANQAQSLTALRQIRRGSILQKSSSLPTLTNGGQQSQVVQPRSPANVADLPPDLLLKKLVSILSDPKHPLRRHPDVFPMLSRVRGGSVRTTATLVIDRKVAEPGYMADGLKNLMKRIAVKTEPDLDQGTREMLTSMRSVIMLLYEGPGGDVLAQQWQLTGLSAKELLDEMEGSVSRPTDLRAALLMLLDHSEKDIEWCLRLRSHKAVERILKLSRRFNNDRSVVGKAVGIMANLTQNDPGCVDRLLENNLAPDIILTLENFPQEPKIQLRGMQVLRRIYQRARELAAHGPRLVILGKNLTEVWTYKGVERVLSNMRTFGDDAAMQTECLGLLTSLGEVVLNGGMAGEVFGLLEVLMRRHAVRADVLAKGVLIIARLGPSFLQHEHRGVFTIIEAMGRHRSNVELQRVGARALLSLAREERALHRCKAGGSVGATVLAMVGHSQDEQVLRDAGRVLEKLCPRGLAKVIAICGDMGLTLPPVSWQEYTQGTAWEPVLLDSEWSAQLLKNFREDVVVGARRRGMSSMSGGTDSYGEADPRGQNDAEVMSGAKLAVAKGYRSVGLREELDAADNYWATSFLEQSRSPARERDFMALEMVGCDTTLLRPPGPTNDQLQRLCESLSEGLAHQLGAQDGELIATLLGHFSWCSVGAARKIVSYGGASALADWLRAPRFRGRSPEEQELAYPMQRACLGALSSICQQDQELANHVMGLGVAQLALDFSSHVDQRMQRATMRLLTRLIPINRDRPPDERVPQEEAWSTVLRLLRDTDEISRTCAAAAAVEMVEDRWLVESEDVGQIEELSSNLLSALGAAVDTGCASAGLPLLLTIGNMLVESDRDYRIAKTLLSHPGQKDQPSNQSQSLVQLLAFWLSKGIATGALAADKAAGIAAATALQSLSGFEAPLPFRELRELLVCGQSTRAEPALREACKNALLISVREENQPQQLAYLLATSVGKGPGGEDRLAETKILKSIAERIVTLLRAGQGQATDPLVSALERVEHLLPKNGAGKSKHAAGNSGRGVAANAVSGSRWKQENRLLDEECKVVLELLVEAKNFRGSALPGSIVEEEEEEEDALDDVMMPLSSSPLLASSMQFEHERMGQSQTVPLAKSSPPSLIHQ